MSTADNFDGRPLRPGAFYWAIITPDPDTDEGEEWMNEVQPVRYDGGGRWNFLGVEGAINWPVSWVGEEIVPNEKSPGP